MSLQVSTLSINPDTRHLETVTKDLPELAEHEVRIQVLFNAISRNDVLIVEGKHGEDYWGVGAVGRVVAVGKGVGSRKVGEAVGVYHASTNRGAFKTGFASYLQVDASQVVFLPTTIPLEQASSLLTEGIVAFNALQQVPKGVPIAVVGTNSQAYLTVQFAKKVFKHHVTVLSLGSAEGVAESFGADAADILSTETIKKYGLKFDAVVVAEQVAAGNESRQLMDIAIRTGKILFLTQFTYSPPIGVFDLIVNQREFVGVKRGSIDGYVNMLQAAAYEGVRGKVNVLPANEAQSGFVKAKESNFAQQIVLQY